MPQAEVRSRDLASDTITFQEDIIRSDAVRKLLAIAAVLGMEVDFIETVVSGSLDDLRRERSNA